MHPANRTGQDFVAGDIHGHFGTVEHALDALAFDPSQDRLFNQRVHLRRRTHAGSQTSNVHERNADPFTSSKLRRLNRRRVPRLRCTRALLRKRPKRARHAAHRPNGRGAARLAPRARWRSPRAIVPKSARQASEPRCSRAPPVQTHSRCRVNMPIPLARSPPLDPWKHGVTRPHRGTARHNPSFGIGSDTPISAYLTNFAMDSESGAGARVRSLRAGSALRQWGAM